MTPSGIARCYFIANGVNLVFGSVEEALAITEFNRTRNITLAAGVLNSSSGESVAKAFRQLNNCVFPERRLDDIKYLKKTSEAFKRFRDMDLRIIKM